MGQQLIVAGSSWSEWISAGLVQALRGIIVVAVFDFVVFVFAVIVVGVQVSPTLDLVHCIFRVRGTGYKAG